MQPFMGFLLSSIKLQACIFTFIDFLPSLLPLKHPITHNANAPKLNAPVETFVYLFLAGSMNTVSCRKLKKKNLLYY